MRILLTTIHPESGHYFCAKPEWASLTSLDMLTLGL
jgi:hypothetical protein